MKKIITGTICIILLQFTALAQLTTLPDGGNKKAMVGERVGLTDIVIDYSRPAVKGREGKIWGGVVAFGFTDQEFGTSKAAPWRAGANEGTTIEFSTPVTIQGKELPAGKYGFAIAVGKEESTLIFSKNHTAWGTFFYTPAEDVLRVPCKQQTMEKSVEFLQYIFTNQTANSAIITLQWERWMFPIKVETDLVKEQLASFRKELQTEKGFTWQAYVQAVNWCAKNNTNLEEALRWADNAISGVFVGEKNFKTLAAKATILNLMGKETDAEMIMKEAAPLGSMNELHGYARQLLAGKKTAAAAEVFRTNYKNHPNTFVTNTGMARALSSEGKFKDALKYATAALPQAPDDANKANAESIIEKLKVGKDVN
ncbi:MAG: DUF2911 domain-containing protein [Ferruginibacter sp.]